jgi:thiosulfate dehydrogenase [quinone] large subunit
VPALVEHERREPPERRADRFGVWGPPGAPHVAWGAFPQFLRYTAALNPLLPASVIPALGAIVTIGEVLLGIALIAGVALPLVGALSGFLLLAFAAGMTLGTGVKTALDASVFAAAAAAFLLALVSAPPDGR